MSAPILKYDGSNFLRQRLVLATLSGRSVKIRKIRHKDNEPGLKDFEASFIRLIDKITNGSRIEINESGTSLYYQPGLLSGGSIEHECNLQRSIGYYLEALVCLAPFTKSPLKATLRGITNDKLDPSIDVIKMVTLPLMKIFGINEEGLEVKVTRRGGSPLGGGEIIFHCSVIQRLKPLQLTQPGKIKKIRGVVYGMRVSPGIINRIVEAAKGVLFKFLPDIYIYSDHMKGPQAGKSAGFGLCLVAESNEGVLLSAEMFSNKSGEEPTVPEDLGSNTARMLLEEIYRGGCVDSRHQCLAFLYMVLGEKDISKVVTGPLSSYSIHFLHHLKDFFQVVFKIDPQETYEEHKGGEKVLFSCVGVGFTNLSKTII